MPLTLDSTAPLQGRKPKRRWTLVVTSHGRWEYLHGTLVALNETVGLRFFDRKVFSFDGALPGADCPPDFDHQLLGSSGWDAPLQTGERKGLTANLTQAWGALTPDDEWVFHVEEDFLIHDAPLEAMADTLDAYRHVANMALVRQPWSDEEVRAGGLLFGSHIQGDVVDRGGWLEHKRIFTLNPFVAPASLLRSLTPAVENSLTDQCRQRGLSFGFWGGLHDPPRVEHIGVENGMGSPGWRT